LGGRRPAYRRGIDGASGDDLICGGDGNDTITGGAGGGGFFGVDPISGDAGDNRAALETTR
jgi:hypothetical protein